MTMTSLTSFMNITSGDVAIEIFP